MLGSSWQLVGSAKPSAAQRGGRHLLDKQEASGYKARQRTRSWQPTRGRRWDGDLDVLLGIDGTMAGLAPCAALAAQRGRRGRHAEDEKRAHLSSSAAARQRTGSQLPMRRAMWRPLDVGRGFGRSLGRS